MAKSKKHMRQSRHNKRRLKQNSRKKPKPKRQISKIPRHPAITLTDQVVMGTMAALVTKVNIDKQKAQEDQS